MSGALQAYYFTSISGKAYWIAVANNAWSGSRQCKVFANGSNVWASQGANGYFSWPRNKLTVSGDNATTNPGITPSDGNVDVGTNYYVYPYQGQFTYGGQHNQSGGNFAGFWTDTSNGDYWLAGSSFKSNTLNGLAVQKANDAGASQWYVRHYGWGNNDGGQWMDCHTRGGYYVGWW